jgi:hypothetical protein
MHGSANQPAGENWDKKRRHSYEKFVAHKLRQIKLIERNRTNKDGIDTPGFNIVMHIEFIHPVGRDTAEEIRPKRIAQIVFATKTAQGSAGNACQNRLCVPFFNSNPWWRDAKAGTEKASSLQERIMTEKEKKEDKGTNLLQTMGESLSNIADTLTGRHLENRIREYTELYADVLLGLHRDLRNLEGRIEALPDKKEMDSMLKGLQIMRRLLIVSLGFSIISLGGVIWTILR